MELRKARIKERDLLIRYKLESILPFNDDESEVEKIKRYVNNTIDDEIGNYKMIIEDNKIIGCMATLPYKDGILFDELYIESEYRNRKIGTSIFKNLMSKNDIIYFWVYKENKNAIRLYERLGFKVIDETKYRFQMKYEK